MSNTDGERIAPVTYLFGTRSSSAVPEETPTDPSPSGAPGEPAPPAAPEAPEPPDVVRVMPRFVDLYPERETVESEPEPATGAPRRREQKERTPHGSFDPINNVSMHALTRRGMSSREMHDYLLGREFESHAVEQEVERLEGVQLLDDAELAHTLVRTLRDRKGLGKAALTAELRRRKLDNDAISLALDELGDDELERAIEVATKRASQLRSYDAETAKRRLSAFMMRKGYSGSVVSTAVQRALAPSGGPTFR